MTPLATATLLVTLAFLAAFLVGFAAGRWSVGDSAPRPRRGSLWRYWRG